MAEVGTERASELRELRNTLWETRDKHEELSQVWTYTHGWCTDDATPHGIVEGPLGPSKPNLIPPLITTPHAPIILHA